MGPKGVLVALHSAVLMAGRETLIPLAEREEYTVAKTGVICYDLSRYSHRTILLSAAF
jgi:hypothetical protein